MYVEDMGKLVTTCAWISFPIPMIIRPTSAFRNLAFTDAAELYGANELLSSPSVRTISQFWNSTPGH